MIREKTLDNMTIAEIVEYKVQIMFKLRVEEEVEIRQERASEDRKKMSKLFASAKEDLISKHMKADTRILTQASVIGMINSYAYASEQGYLDKCKDLRIDSYEGYGDILYFKKALKII